MDVDRFDTLARTLSGSPSRRRVFAAVLGSLVTFGALPIDAKMRRKKKKPKKPKLNAFGCLNVGQPCRGKDDKCCSGICQGKKPKKGKRDKSRCVGHDAGICAAELDVCTVGESVLCNPNDPTSTCVCTLTTGNAGFCIGSAAAIDPASFCRFCSKDTDCQPEFGPGAACVVLRGACTPFCAATGGTACAPPCA